MKRSGTVGLVMMGGAAFAGTFALGMAYFAWQKPSHAAPAQPQNCTTRADGTQDCKRSSRGFAYFLYPSYFSGSSGASASEPKRTQGAALTSQPRIASTPASRTVRDGFGSTAKRSIRVSAGG